VQKNIHSLQFIAVKVVLVTKHNVVGCRLLVDPLNHDISGKVGLDIFVRLYLFLRF